jgi:hypothetical protein
VTRRARAAAARARGAALACVAALALVLAPAPARAFEDDTPPARFFLDRIEVGGGWHRQTCDDDGSSAERARVGSHGLRLHKFVSRTMYVGFDLGRVNRTGSRHPVLGEGTTGAVLIGLEDEDLAWSGGLATARTDGFTRVCGSARVGGRDQLHLSASYARSVPVFSSDDVDVGMGSGIGDGHVFWVGASMPINRDVVGVKARAIVRALPRLEVTGEGRYGNTEAGHIEGFALSIAYVNPEGEATTRLPGRLGHLLDHEPQRFEYIGAGGIVGAVSGVMVAGAAVQRPCGDAAFRPALIGVIGGALLGAVFGNAMW